MRGHQRLKGLHLTALCRIEDGKAKKHGQEKGEGSLNSSFYQEPTPAIMNPFPQ